MTAQNFALNSPQSGMNELKTLVLDMYKDIKRVSSAIAPQSAAKMIRKHNKDNPDAPWKLYKKDDEGPDDMTNMGDLNNDGIPDVVVLNHKNQPVFINGYTTRRSKWPDDLLYHSGIAAMSPAEKKAYIQEHGRYLFNGDGNPIVDSEGNPVKTLSKKEFLRNMRGFKYYDIDDAPSPADVGTIKSWNEDLPLWYQQASNSKHYKVMDPTKRLSAYKRYQSYVFKPLFDNAVRQLAAVDHRELTGAEKMQLFGKIASGFWTVNTNQLIDPDGSKDEEQLKKDRKTKEAKTVFDEYVNNTLNLIKTQPGFSDRFQNEIYTALKSVLGI